MTKPKSTFRVRQDDRRVWPRILTETRDPSIHNNRSSSSGHGYHGETRRLPCRQAPLDRSCGDAFRRYGNSRGRSWGPNSQTPEVVWFRISKENAVSNHFVFVMKGSTCDVATQDCGDIRAGTGPARKKCAARHPGRSYEPPDAYQTVRSIAPPIKGFGLDHLGLGMLHQ